MHKSNGGYDFWDKEKDKILELYFQKNLSSNKIGEIYNCNGSTILRQFKRWGIETKKRYNAIYKVNEDFFSVIDTEEKAYCLGLILTDGHVSKGNTIMLTMKDLDIIEKFQSALNSNHPIKFKNKCWSINIRSKRLCDDLRNIGLHNQKSYYIDFNKVLSFVPKELLHHFVNLLEFY